MGSLEKIAQTNVTSRVMDVMMSMVPVTWDVTLDGLGTIVIKVVAFLFTLPIMIYKIVRLFVFNLLIN